MTLGIFLSLTARPPQKGETLGVTCAPCFDKGFKMHLYDDSLHGRHMNTGLSLYLNLTKFFLIFIFTISESHTAPPESLRMLLTKARRPVEAHGMHVWLHRLLLTLNSGIY